MLDPRSLDHFAGKTLLITGGTGSLGKTITRLLLERSKARKIVILSRDELKQYEMHEAFKGLDTETRLRYFLGDVRDRERLMMAFSGVDIIIHAAALKQVPAAEYNPFEFVKTTILGAQNLIEAAIERGVERVIALSTDKAANPINLYGATKFCSDKLFVAANHYAGGRRTRFAAVRYGNVVGSRGSVIPFFLEQRKTGTLTITHPDMTRFWITLEQAAHFVLNCSGMMTGEEIFIPKIPSMKVSDLAQLMGGPKCQLKIIGIRPGEKMHEVMVPEELGRGTLEFDRHFVIMPAISSMRDTDRWPGGRLCPEGFSYRSDNNPRFMNEAEMRSAIRELGLPGCADF